jgi:hypothetical protein
VPKSSNASSYALVSSLYKNISIKSLDETSRKNLLANLLRSAQHRLSSTFRFLFPTRLIPLFFLLLIRKRRKSTRSFANLDVLEWFSQCTHMLLDERRVERFMLVSFDDVFDDFGREGLEVVFCAWVGGDEGV